jgi:CDP-glucose 4,6-dehydratase
MPDGAASPIRTCLITGGRGFVGAWLSKALLERGHRVVSFDRARAGQGPSPIGLLGVEDEVTHVDGDLLDADLLARTLDQHQVDTVFHLAAVTIVGAVQASPVLGYEINVRGTWLLLDACRAHGAERVVVASSDKAYGANADLPYREDHPPRPTAPYEASKAAADLIARTYWSSYGLPVAVTRFANIYGGADLSFSRLIPEAVSAAVRGRSPILRSDGSPERDFLYVEDATAAYLALADHLHQDDVRGEAFNAGGGRPWAVGEVIRLIAQLSGADLEPVRAGAGSPAGEIDRQWLDATKIRERCGWTPAVGLEEGLARTIDWYRRHPESMPA